MTRLAVDELHAAYGARPVVHGISFEVDEGDIAVILGANGAGKTTVLRALSGLVATTGSITFGDREIARRRADELVRLGIAHVPQGRGVFAELSVEENLRIGAYVRGRDSAVGADLERWFGFFPRLRERRRQSAGSLSGGEQQMVAIARALMMRPRLLLLDEPSLGLAPLVTRELFGVLRHINDELGTTMLIVEQNAQLALDIAGYGYVLESGHLVHKGAAHALREDDQVRRAYLGY